MKTVSVVVLSHNRKNDLEKNLLRLLSEWEQPCSEIIVVDNDSTDGTVEMLRELSVRFPYLKVLYNQENKGVAGGRNTGFRATSGDFIVALDDDTTISLEKIKRVPLLFSEFPRAGILAFRVRHAVTGEWQNDHGEAPCLVANHHGAGWALRRDVLTQVGGIDELCTFGAEELDLAIRSHATGFEVTYVPSLVVDHNSVLHSGPEGERRRELRVYNNVRVLHKHFPLPMATIFSFRYLASAIFSWWGKNGFLGMSRLLAAAIKGRAEGRNGYAPVPKRTLALYRSRKLSPDYGNVPLLSKARGVARRTLANF